MRRTSSPLCYSLSAGGVGLVRRCRPAARRCTRRQPRRGLGHAPGHVHLASDACRCVRVCPSISTHQGARRTGASRRPSPGRAGTHPERAEEATGSRRRSSPTPPPRPRHPAPGRTARACSGARRPRPRDREPVRAGLRPVEGDVESADHLVGQVVLERHREPRRPRSRRSRACRRGSARRCGGPEMAATAARLAVAGEPDAPVGTVVDQVPGRPAASTSVVPSRGRARGVRPGCRCASEPSQVKR